MYLMYIYIMSIYYNVYRYNDIMCIYIYMYIHMYMICRDYSCQQIVWGLMNRGDNSRVMFGGSLRIFTGRGDPHCRNSSRRSRHASVIQNLKCSGFLKSTCWCTVSGVNIGLNLVLLSQWNQPRETIDNRYPQQALDTAL